MSLVEVKVPDIGDFSDVPVIELFVKVGDSIKVDDAIATLESDKATMDVPSSAAGMIKEVKVALGDRVGEGNVLIVVETDGASANPAPATAAAPAAAAPASTLISTAPSLTREPSWTSTSLTVPSTVQGTSIVALSDSSVAMASSILMLSPTLTNRSMTGTSEKSPISLRF